MLTDNLSGRHIDNFTILERIGRGGMATVYRAHQPSVNRDVALKVLQLDDDTMSEHNFRDRFAQEAEVIASLEHIHILPVYDYGIVDDIAYLAMRLLRGGTVSELLRDGPLRLDQTVKLFGQITRGLAYAHSKGVIHRDLKPSNIMLDDEGNACLTDFGLAKIVSGSNNFTQTGNIVGTPTYMSPEQLRGDPVDHRSDIYSLGVILYQMLTGRPPFEAETSDVVTVIYRHLEKAPQPPRQLNPNIPADVEAVVLRALAKKPEARYGSAGEMANALRVAAGLKPSSSSYPPVNVEETTRIMKLPIRRMYGLLTVGIVLVILIGGLLVFSINQAEHPLPKPTVLTGEGGSQDAAVPTQEEIEIARRRLGDNGFIAFIACNRTSEYHAGAAREISELAAGYALPLRIYDSNNDEYSQITLIEQARADGARGVIICPLNFELLHEQLTSIDNADLPLVLFSASENRYGGVLIEGDNYLMGLKPGQFAGEIILQEMDGLADVIILDYPDLPSIIQRADGLQDGMLEVAPQANVIGRYLGATRENAQRSVSRLLEDGVTFDVILSINDAGSYGAIAALEEAGYGPADVIIISVDAEVLAQQHIRNGYFIRGSVMVDRLNSTRAMVNSMVKLLGGGTIPEQILVPPGDIFTADTLLES